MTQYTREMKMADRCYSGSAVTFSHLASHNLVHGTYSQ